MSKDTRAVLLALVAVLSWSTVATAFKVALSYLSHDEMLTVACVASLLVFTVVLTVQRKWGGVARLHPMEWGRFALLGLLNPVAYYLVLFKAYDLLPAQVAQPINYAWPIVLLVLLALFADEPIPRKKYIGMALSLAGVALISLGGGGVTGDALSPAGLLLAALSALLWATYWMVNKRVGSRADSSIVLWVSFLSSSIVMLLFVGPRLMNHLTLSGALASGYVGWFEMGIPFICFGAAMRTTSNPALINQLCYLSPFLSLAFIATVLGECILPTTYIGLLLIVGGIVFNQYFCKGKR